MQDMKIRVLRVIYKADIQVGSKSCLISFRSYCRRSRAGASFFSGSMTIYITLRYLALPTVEVTLSVRRITLRRGSEFISC
jgi:hypothetical protein